MHVHVHNSCMPTSKSGPLLTVTYCHPTTHRETQTLDNGRAHTNTHSQWWRCLAFVRQSINQTQGLTWDREDGWEMCWQSKEVKVHGDVFHAMRGVSGTREKESSYKFTEKERGDEKSSSEECKLNSRSRYFNWGYEGKHRYTRTHICFILTMMESTSERGYSCRSPHVSYHIAGAMATAA